LAALATPKRGEVVDADDDVAQLIAPADDLEFRRGDDALLEGDVGDVADVGIRIVVEATGLLRLAILASIGSAAKVAATACSMAPTDLQCRLG